MEEKSEKRTTRRYPPETRAEAVRLVVDEYMSSDEVAERFAMPAGTVSAWASEERSARRRAAAALRKQKEESVPDVKSQEMRARIYTQAAQISLLRTALNDIRDMISNTFDAISE